MKKFLSYALVAMMLVAAVAVSVSAVDFKAGDGYDVYAGASYSEAEAVRKSPVTLTKNDDGSVTVEQGGYYCNYTGDNNYGGVSTATKVGLDGLEVVIDFDTVPSATNDCWFGLLLLQEDHVFNTGDMATSGGYNPLIRFNVPNVEFYNPSFGGVGTSKINGNLFGLESGDTLKMNVEYKYGQYIVTYDHNGVVYEVPAAWTKDASNLLINQGGEAYVVVTGTLLGESSDWKYTVSVKEGEPIDESDLANQAFEESKLTAKTEIDSLKTDVENNYIKANELAGNSDDEAVLEAVAEVEDAKNSFDAAVTALENAASEDDVNAALAQARSAKATSGTAVETLEFLAETAGDDEEPADEPDATPAEEDDNEGGLSTGLIIAIVAIVVVVVAVVAVVVLGKKKKQ